MPEQPPTDFGDALCQAFARVKEISEELLADVLRCHDVVRQIPISRELSTEEKKYGQFWIRNYVRAFFAQVDGVGYAMRRSVLDLYEQDFLRISPAEFCVLSETRYFFDNGQIRAKQAFNRSLDNVGLSLQHFPKAFRATYKPKTSGPGWGAFSRAMQKRNGLSHPKSMQDLFLSPDEIRDFGEAFQWFSGEVVEMLQACLVGLESFRPSAAQSDA